jgi:hypothetical protein
MRAPSALSASIPISLALALLLGGPSGRAAPGPPAPQAGGEEVSGTVHRVDVESRTLELLTGVGHALRLVTMKVAADCDIHVEGASASLGNLKRAQIVRVRYTGAGGERLARAIETVARDARGGAR